MRCCMFFMFFDVVDLFSCVVIGKINVNLFKFILFLSKLRIFDYYVSSRANKKSLRIEYASREIIHHISKQ